MTLATAGAGGTIAAVRNLGASGVDVEVISSEWLAAAAWSRHTKRTHSAPSESNVEQFLDRLLAIGESNPGRILLPTSDATAWIYAENALLLKRYFRLYHPTITTLRRILDKKLFEQAALSVGLSVLPSWDPPGLEELEALAPSLPFPVLIKPRTHVHRINNDKGVVVATSDELIREYRRFVEREQGRTAGTPLLPDARRPILQKFVRVTDEGVLSVTGFIDRSGELFVTRAARKVLQRSQPVGVGVCFEAQPAPAELPDLVRGLCRELDYFGLFEVEFIRNNGHWAVIDFNPRMFSQVGMDIRRGMPLPLLACLDAVGDTTSLREEVARAQSGDDDRVVFSDRFTLRAILVAQFLTARMSSERLARWRNWMKAHAGHAVDFAADRNDRLPGIVHMLSELYLGLRSLPRFVCAKSTAAPSTQLAKDALERQPS
ncbi:ATP-grasp domain-containing protein [Bradyrhizobium sp.]|uniref:ATP-grasp domain-containing protein n=1 Tax=Bradyrhizobium sp. TaxID=376 RepID=UPI0025BF1335|nr:ATP-grasp domain-containing protein [Bradyrhizobium sp.]